MTNRALTVLAVVIGVLVLAAATVVVVVVAVRGAAESARDDAAWKACLAAGDAATEPAAGDDAVGSTGDDRRDLPERP